MNLGEFLYSIQSFLKGRDINKKMGLEEFNYCLKLINHELYRIKIGFGDDGGFETKEQISDVIEDFISEPTSIALVDGIGDLPADYNRRVGLYYLDDSSNKIPIDIVSSEVFINRQNNANRQPSTTHPYARVRNSKIEVAPTSITPVYLTYIKLPTTPVLSMELDDGIMIYDASSTEFAWKEEYHIDLLRLMLKHIGVSDDDLVGLAGFVKSELNEQNA